LINRQIYKGAFTVIIEGDLTSENSLWWKGLGEELEVDIETLAEKI